MVLTFTFFHRLQCFSSIRYSKITEILTQRKFGSIMHSENTRQPTLLHLQTTSIWTNVTNMLSWPSRQLKKTCVPRHCQFKFSQICLTWLPWSNVNVCLVQSKETSRFGRVTNFSDLSKIIFSGFVMVNNTELCDKLRVLKMLFISFQICYANCPDPKIQNSVDVFSYFWQSFSHFLKDQVWT